MRQPTHSLKTWSRLISQNTKKHSLKNSTTKLANQKNSKIMITNFQKMFFKKCDKATCLLVVLCFSFVIELGLAFSPIISVLRSSSFSSVTLFQSKDADDDNSKPFFFTGEARSDLENKELRRVFLGIESVSQRQESEELSIGNHDGVKDSIVNIEQERENLERLFHL